MEIATIVRIDAPEERVWPLLGDFTTHVVYRLSEEGRRPVPTMRCRLDLHSWLARLMSGIGATMTRGASPSGTWRI
jgi:hypothetical protein